MRRTPQAAESTWGEAAAALRVGAGRLRVEAATHGPPDLSLFYRLAVSESGDEDPEEFARRLPGSGPDELADSLADLTSVVHAAYFKPRPYGASVTAGADAAYPDARPDPAPGLPGSRPAGIDAQSAWSWPGGHGEGVRIVDVEDAWCFTHEDLLLTTGGSVDVQASSSVEERNHGTAVAGMLSGDVNTIGIVGICPAAQFEGVSIAGEPGGSAAALRRAAERLRAGDVLLVESHNAGPTTAFNGVDRRTNGRTASSRWSSTRMTSRRSGTPWIAASWWWPLPEMGESTSPSVTKVARRGRGGRRVPWPNPFLRDPGGDSGSILVGAGAAPGSARPARSRLKFSNYGICIDAQGWGEKVATAGGKGDGRAHDLQGGRDEDRWYTASFSGTSSAAAMVAGAVVGLQGIVRAMGRSPLTPREVRTLLRETGTAQTAGPDGDPATHRVGSLPDLRQLIDRLGGRPGGAAMPTVPQYGPGPAVVVLCGCGDGGVPRRQCLRPTLSGPHWSGPHWSGPHWSGPHWSGPHWSGPHWSGPSVEGPRSIPSRPGFAD